MYSLRLKRLFRTKIQSENRFFLTKSSRFVPNYVLFLSTEFESKSKSKTISKSDLKMCKESQVSKDLLERCEMEGSKVKIDSGNATNLDCINRIGMVERRGQFDEKEIETILPSMVYHKKPLILPNINFNDERKKEHFYKYHQKPGTFHAFCRGLPGITPECLSGSEYYFEDGLRKVKPYYFILESQVTRCPERLTLIEYVAKVLTRANSDWMRYRIEKGYIQVNFETKSPDDYLKEGDFFTSLNHYHENPVLDEPINIIFENQDILVVSKPPSYLIYPACVQRFNTLQFVLAKEKGYLDLRPVHRLDKNTSGVCIFAKRSSVTRKLQGEFKSGDVSHRKEYLAMVEGSFPEQEVTSEMPLVYFSISSNLTKQHLQPKASVTSFKRLGYDGRTSLVHCIPKTGRTHQIRLHLQMLGHPVVNDVLYNPEDQASRYDIDRTLVEAAVQRIKAKPSPSSNDVTVCQRHHSKASKRKQDSSWQQSLTSRIGEKAPDCLLCELGPEFEKEKASNERMFMGLHSWKYTVNNMTFEAPLPKWATDSTYLDQIYETRKNFQPQNVQLSEI